MSKYKYYIIASIILLISGFLLGRYTVEIKEVIKTEYTPGPPRDSIIYKPFKVKVEVPTNVDTLDLFLYCINKGLYSYLIPKDTIIRSEYIKVDTLAILSDWLTKRNYDITLFDNDSIGKLTVQPSIQYNELQSIGYNYIPMQKTTTIIKSKSFNLNPFIGAGLDGLGMTTIQVGLFINNWGLGIHYNNNFKDYSSGGFDVIYKF